MSNFHFKVIGGYTAIGSGIKTATPFGTPVALVSTPTPFKVVLISPLGSNTGIVVVGDVNVVATPVASTRGYVVATPQGAIIEGDDLADVYMQSAIANEGVSFTFYK